MHRTVAAAGKPTFGRKGAGVTALFLEASDGS